MGWWRGGEVVLYRQERPSALCKPALATSKSQAHCSKKHTAAQPKQHGERHIQGVTRQDGRYRQPVRTETDWRTADPALNTESARILLITAGKGRRAASDRILQLPSADTLAVLCYGIRTYDLLFGKQVSLFPRQWTFPSASTAEHHAKGNTSGVRIQIRACHSGSNRAFRRSIAATSCRGRCSAF
jgi:hypothetical protein